MTINKKMEGGVLTVALDGRLDTMTAPELEKELEGFAGAEKLVFDLTGLEYVSSAGLRVFLRAHKLMNGNMTVRGANEMINEIFEVTGFTDVFDIE